MFTIATLIGATLLAAGDDPLFDTNVRFRAGDSPDHVYLRDMVLEDLDNDGDLDAVISRRGGWFGGAIPVGLTVVENLGDGCFGQPVHFNIPGGGAGDGLSRLVLADIDGDGDKDAAVSRPGAWSTDGHVALFLKDAGLSFTYVGTVITTGPGAAGIGASDLDGDGLIDLAVALPGGGFDTELAILLNGGSSNFTALPTIQVGAVPNKLDIGDIDGDGDLDLAVACRNATVVLLLNDGTASFTVSPSISTQGTQQFYCDVALGDIDNDGDLDLVAPRDVGTPLSSYQVKRNDGTGQFGPWEVKSMPANMGMSSIKLIDVDEDGWLDVLLAGSDPTVNGAWAIGLNDQAGNLPPITDGSRIHGGEGIEAIDAADMDSDGLIDIVTIGGNSIDLDVFLNPGNHVFRPGVAHDAEGAHHDIVAGDIDNDGDIDIISNSYTGSGLIHIRHNDGSGGMILAQVLDPSAPSGVKLGDINGDGFLDLAWVENTPPYEAYTSLNQGDGTFGSPAIHQIRCGGPGDNNLYDVNNDGHLDHIVVNRLAPYEGNVGVSLGNGDGTFQPDNLYWVDTLARGLEGADLNGDGNIDLIATRWTPGSCCEDSIAVLFGYGDGTFQDKVDVPVDFDPWDIVAADLNGDGIVDLATCNSGAANMTTPQIGSETISVLLGNGDGTFQSRVDYAGVFSPDYMSTQSIIAADPDADGDLDLLVTNAGAHDVSLYTNQGDGTFAPVVRYGTVGSPLDLVCVDLTGDGVADLATVGFTASPSSDACLTIIFGNSTTESPADITGDGIVDLADLLAVIAGWGPCGDVCPADVNADGAVNLPDLLAVIAGWSSG